MELVVDPFQRGWKRAKRLLGLRELRNDYVHQIGKRSLCGLEIRHDRAEFVDVAEGLTGNTVVQTQVVGTETHPWDGFAQPADGMELTPAPVALPDLDHLAVAGVQQTSIAILARNASSVPNSQAALIQEGIEVRDIPSECGDLFLRRISL